MELKQVMAIVRTDVVEVVESRLVQLGVPGITISRVKGFGEYVNFLNPTWISPYVRIDIFADVTQAQQIADAIMEAAHTGKAGDGFISVLPVDRLYRIRDHRELRALHGPQVQEATRDENGPRRADRVEEVNAR